jgi:hypothetical protein
MDTPNVHPDPLTLADFGIYATRCSGNDCRAEIGFVPTAESKASMPVNWVADPAGNVRLEPVTGRPPNVVAVVVEQAELITPVPDIRWMPHHATCPNADEWRRPK